MGGGSWVKIKKKLVLDLICDHMETFTNKMRYSNQNLPDNALCIGNTVNEFILKHDLMDDVSEVMATRADEYQLRVSGGVMN